jgi:hypothetical protein
MAGYVSAPKYGARNLTTALLLNKSPSVRACLGVRQVWLATSVGRTCKFGLTNPDRRLFAVYHVQLLQKASTQQLVTKSSPMEHLRIALQQVRKEGLGELRNLEMETVSCDLMIVSSHVPETATGSRVSSVVC